MPAEDYVLIVRRELAMQLLILCPELQHRMPRQTGQEADEVMVEVLQDCCCEGRLNGNTLMITRKHSKQLSADSVTISERSLAMKWNKHLTKMHFDCLG